MNMLRGLVAVALGLSLVVPATAHAQLEPEVPAPEAWESDPADTTPQAPPPSLEPTAVPPPSPVDARAVPPAPAFNGRGLVIAAIAVTALSWTSRLVGMGIGLSLPASSDDYGDVLRKAQASAAFTYIAPIAQLTATGLVIPGGILRGRSDGHSLVTTGAPTRNARGLLVGGAVVFGVFTAVSIALRPAVLLGCFGAVRSCGGTGAYVGYMLGVQASDTLSTAGAGMMSYGIAYRNMEKTYGTRVAIAPFSSRGAYGLSLSGRF